MYYSIQLTFRDRVCERILSLDDGNDSFIDISDLTKKKDPESSLRAISCAEGMLDSSNVAEGLYSPMYKWNGGDDLHEIESDVRKIYNLYMQNSQYLEHFNFNEFLEVSKLNNLKKVIYP